MRRKTFGRVLGVLCLATSFALATAGSASASPPRWSMTVKNLPPKVAAGNAMGYQITISNAGPSNISQLFLVTETPDSPAYIPTPSQGSCAPAGSGPLACTFGALNAKKSVTVIVAYAGPVSNTYDPGDPVFQGNSNGLTFSDGGSSHGDTLSDPNEKPTTISTGNGNFAGGFSLSDVDVSTDKDLSDSNKQATSVTPPQPRRDGRGWTLGHRHLQEDLHQGVRRVVRDQRRERPEVRDLLPDHPAAPRERCAQQPVQDQAGARPRRRDDGGAGPVQHVDLAELHRGHAGGNERKDHRVPRPERQVARRDLSCAGS